MQFGYGSVDSCIDNGWFRDWCIDQVVWIVCSDQIFGYVVCFVIVVDFFIDYDDGVVFYYCIVKCFVQCIVVGY